MTEPFRPPDKQPPGKWVLKLPEVKGEVRGEDFNDFVRKVNDALVPNGFPALTSEQILARVNDAQNTR